MIKKFKRVLMFSMVSLNLLLISGPVMGEKVLKIIPHADLKNLDPIWTTAYITRNHGYMIYDTLIGLDSDLKPQPQMLDKWDVSNDGLTYTFTLRDGLQWHDGKPVRSADCIASINGYDPCISS